MTNQVLTDNQQIPYSVVEWDIKGNPTPVGPSDTVNISSSDTASITIVPDAVPAAGVLGSGMIVAGSKEQIGVSVTFTLASPGHPAIPPTVLLFDVTGDVPATLSVTLGTPVPQTPATTPPPPTGGAPA